MLVDIDVGQRVVRFPLVLPASESTSDAPHDGLLSICCFYFPSTAALLSAERKPNGAIAPQYASPFWLHTSCGRSVVCCEVSATLPVGGMLRPEIWAAYLGLSMPRPVQAASMSCLH